MLNVYEQIDSNKRKSTIVVILFISFITIILWILGQAFGYGFEYLGLALIFAGLTGFSSYYWSDKIILKLSGARPASRKNDFLFFTVTENLCIPAQIPMPKLYVIQDSAMNAFATGRDPKNAVVCATTGLLNNLNRTELEGVIAHELSHVKNFDIRLMSVVTVMVGVITLLSDWMLRSTMHRRGNKSRNKSGEIQGILLVIGIFLALLSPIIAKLIQLAISRRREFLADAGSAMLTRQPTGLSSALKKLSADAEPLEIANKATAHLYIVNPLKNVHKGIGKFASLFRTHPPISARIKALDQMM